MTFTKNTGAAVSISIISLIIFNAVAFLTPFLHTVTFWLGYCFATMSIVVLLISSLVLFGKNDSNTKFLSVPQFNVALIYFILQIALSFAEMTNSFLTYKIAIIINCVLIAVFLIAFLLVGIGKSAVESRDSYTNSKEIYFGSYNGNSVAWIILEQKDDKMFLLAKEPVIQMPISNQIEKVNWKDSTLNEWLNHDFLAEFTDEQMNKIDKKNGAFLLSQKDFEKYKKDTDFSATTDWWLSTKSDDGFMYIEKNGSINENGDMAIRAKGIRPAMWISVD